MIRVAIVDDQALVRTGIATILAAQADIDVIGEAADGEQALKLVREVTPDIVCMDIRMPVLDGLEATRRLLAGRGPHPRVLILTTFDADVHVYDAMKAGASGFMLKDAPRDQLVAAVRTVAAGDALLAPAVTRRFVEDFVARPRPGDARPQTLERLTDRETEVLVHVARGLSNTEIARHLTLGEATVRTHVSSILGKLGLRDRVQAVVVAYESGLVRPGDGPP